MTLPRQAAPVLRGMDRVRRAPALVMPSSCWGSCMVSALESQLNVNGLAGCASITSLTSFVSCVAAIVGDLGIGPTTIVGYAAADAISCGIDCAF